MMDAGAWIALAALAVVIVTSVGGGIATAVWTVRGIQATGDKLDGTLSDLSGDVQVLSKDVSGLTVVVKSLEHGQEDHEERLRRIERDR